jgi:outer membrane protein TolC
VLTALREVEQALARYSGEIERNVALRRADTAATNAARIAILRFDAGRDSLLQRIDAERDRAGARAALAQSNAALAEAQVALFKALGGGWEGAPVPVRREAAAATATP